MCFSWAVPPLIWTWRSPEPGLTQYLHQCRWARSQLAPMLQAPVGLINAVFYTTERDKAGGGGGRAKRRWLEGTGEKMSLIHFAYQSIYTFKKIVTYAFCKFSMLKD